MSTIKPKPFEGLGSLNDITKNWDYLDDLGVDHYSTDDTQFNVSHVYCSAHIRVHATGWCLVMNALKLPVNDDLPEEYRTA